MKTFPADSLPCAYQMVFTPDSTRLIVGGMDGFIYILQLDAVHQSFDLIQRLQPDPSSQKLALYMHLVVSLDNQWLAISTQMRQVFIINMDSYKVNLILY
jgi:hypothetical protein